MHRDHGGNPRAFQALIGVHMWQVLRSLGTVRTYRPGAFLLRQGEVGDFVLALTGGRVKVLAAAADGSQVLLAFRGMGDLVGEMASSSGVRSATVQALDRCTAWRISGDAFRDFLFRNDVQSALSDYLVSKLSETVPYQVQQAHFSPLRRLSRLLLEVLALADDDQADRMRIPLSQEAIANALGLARSTVAEQISRLRKAHALTAGPRLVVADPDQLARSAGLGTD